AECRGDLLDRQAQIEVQKKCPAVSQRELLQGAFEVEVFDLRLPRGRTADGLSKKRQPEPRRAPHIATLVGYDREEPGTYRIPGLSWSSLRQARVNASWVASSASLRSPSMERASLSPGSIKGRTRASNAASSPAIARNRSGSSTVRLIAYATPNETPAGPRKLHQGSKLGGRSVA